MTPNNNQLNQSQTPQVYFTQRESCILLFLLDSDVTEINSKILKEASFKEQISRTERDIARLRFKIGIIDQLGFNRELNRIEIQEEQSLIAIRDWALVKGSLLKIIEKISFPYQAGVQSHAA